MVFAARGESLTNARVREILGLDSHSARRSLQRLRDKGLLIQLGERGGAEYLMGAVLPPLSGHLSEPIVDDDFKREINRYPSEYASRRLSDDEIDALILDLARGGPVTNSLVRERTGLDRIEALAVLAHLVDTGRLERRGERRGSHYVLVESL